MCCVDRLKWQPIADIGSDARLALVRLRTAGILIALGLMSACGAEGPAQRLGVIKEAEARSAYGANPKWLELTSQRDLFRRVRDRGYVYCLRGTSVEDKCAFEQDQAVLGAVAAIFLAEGLRGTPNKNSLTPKERELVFDPAILPRVLNTCWSLYKEHGASDARILSVCLGNLTDYSPLIPLPAP